MLVSGIWDECDKEVMGLPICSTNRHADAVKWWKDSSSALGMLTLPTIDANPDWAKRNDVSLPWFV
jgi:hypothetical protein